MALRLFRSTGYSSILWPGETRGAMHPGWLVAAVSGWVGFVCNVTLWRQLAVWPDDGAGLLRALTLGLFVAAACAFVLSLLGWRKTLKPAATLILLLAAIGSSRIWGEGLAFDLGLADKRLSSILVPSWASLLRWQVSALLVALALPVVWVWHTSVRRLSGPQQLGVNLAGALLAGALLAASGFMLTRSAA